MFTYPTAANCLYYLLGDYQLPKYITFIRNPPLRRAMTSWRLSCHLLPIERGRYQGISRCDRICSKCNIGEVGDEMHALFNCTNIIIKSLRDQFLTRIISISNQFSSLSNKVKLLYIMRSHDNDIIPVICEWIRKINEQYATIPIS